METTLLCMLLAKEGVKTLCTEKGMGSPGVTLPSPGLIIPSDGAVFQPRPTRQSTVFVHDCFYSISLYFIKSSLYLKSTQFPLGLLLGQCFSKVQSLNQQHQCHLYIYSLKCKVSGPTIGVLNQKFQEPRLALCLAFREILMHVKA